ncbi:MAG: hypothetical protein Fur0043_24700 [Anaerolineales bacterium]
MKTMYKLLTLLLLSFLILLPTRTVHAGGAQDGRVIFGENYTLPSGQTLDGDLVVFGGNVVIEDGAVVQGDVVVMGGSITVNGVIEGSTVIIGGSVSLGETSVIESDLVTIGGTLSRAEGAQVKGQVVTNIPAPAIEIPNVPHAPSLPTSPLPARPAFNLHFDPLGKLIRLFANSLAMALLAMLSSLFLKPQSERVAQAIVGQPVIAGSVGLLVMMLSPVALIILSITIILIPVAALAVAVLALAWLFGVIAIGIEVGERFTSAIHQTWALPLTAGFGTFLMMLVVNGIGMIPCLGWLFPALMLVLSIGGVTLTAFGSRPSPRLITSSTTAPPPTPVG